MAHVQITMLEGRTIEQKRRAVKRITEVMQEELNVNPEKLTIAFVEVPRHSYARNGILISDRNPSPEARAMPSSISHLRGVCAVIGEQVEKQIPRRLKPAGNDKMEDLYDAAEAAPLQNNPAKSDSVSGGAVPWTVIVVWLRWWRADE